ncbi:MAG TPA: nitrous oxide reductase accessory protein NosL [Chitinophagaceae bacterium]|nr:nitrous oxide reductase accessory protein NosL [Chitinophagaceae bacterium]
MKHDLSIPSRILVAFASGALIAVFFLPAWRIDLFAPQYPEGLTMNIWINGLSGEVDVINGLNHYIGMQHINESMFPEFRFLPYVVGFFMLLGMIVSITGRRKFLFAYLVLTGIGGLLAMYDFWKWGKDYGSKLDPTAPIQVPGLTYQPPLIGHKRLLNFDAYSFPDVGGWVVIAAGTLAFTVWFVEWYRHRKPGGFFRKKSAALLALPLAGLISCSTKPSPFAIGRDNCHFCKMGITDTRYGAELITKKGKIYKFDDLHCLVKYMQSGVEKKGQISKTLTILFEHPNEFLEVEQAAFVTDLSLKSPMGSNTAGFTNSEEARKFIADKPTAVLLNWQQLFDKTQ